MTIKAFRSLPKRRVAGQVPVDVEKSFRCLSAELDLPQNLALTEALKSFIQKHSPSVPNDQLNQEPVK